jgi:prephenate dehydrogenase
MRVIDKVRHVKDIQRADFEYLKSRVSAGHTPKVTIPSPTMLHFRGGRAGISREHYPDLEPFYQDVADAYGDELRSLAPHLGPATLVTDAGSTKGEVVQAARAELGAAFSRFVPGHPIAGTEHSGPQAAFASLYRDQRVVLTPTSDTDPHAIARVREAWQACGARVYELPAELHDRVLATVSHLPHLLAFALVDLVARSDDAHELFSYAAGGFRDFTRIASSHPEMWRDICLANRDAVLRELQSYEKVLATLRSALENADAGAIEALFQRARSARNEWLARSKAPGSDE